MCHLFFMADSNNIHNSPDQINTNPTQIQEVGDVVDVGQKKFEQLEWIAKVNPQLLGTVRLLKNSIIAVIQSNPEKESLLKDALSNPNVYTTNPKLFQSLFSFIQPKLNDAQEDKLEEISKEIYNQYQLYISSKLITLRNVALWKNQIAQKIEAEATQRTVVVEKVEAESSKDKAESSKDKAESSRDKLEASRDKLEAEKLKNAVNQTSETLPPQWKSGMGKFVEENQNNQKLINDAARMNSGLGLPQEWESSEWKEVQINNYLRAVYLAEHQWAIRADIQKLEQNAPEWEKEKYRKQLESFDAGITTLNGLNFPRPVKEIGPDFPTTRPVETARIQAEKLEKTHDVYRDGTSLYFVNKSDPKDIKRIDILVDRAVYTMMKNGLSLSTDLTLVTHEEKEKREAIRKVGTEHEKAEWAYQKTLWEFFPIRAWEYEKKIAGTEKTGMEILRSRGGEWVQVQEAYDDAERQLMRLNPENAKSWERTELIQKMKEQTERLKTWNQWFFILKEFGGTEKDIIESDGMKTMFEQRSAWLRSLGQSIEQSETRKTEFEKAQKWFNPDDTRFEMKDWNESARWYLSELTSDSIGLNGLSDESFQVLLSQLEKRDEEVGIWKTGISLGQDTTLRDNQQKELRSFSQKVGGREGWQKIEKQLRIDGTLANRAFKWDDRQFQKWIQSLDKPQSETP